MWDGSLDMISNYTLRWTILRNLLTSSPTISLTRYVPDKQIVCFVDFGGWPKNVKVLENK